MGIEEKLKQVLMEYGVPETTAEKIAMKYPEVSGKLLTPYSRVSWIMSELSEEGFEPDPLLMGKLMKLLK